MTEQNSSHFAGNSSIDFRHVGLTVADLDRSLAFWRDGLGLEVIALQEQQGGYIEEITREPMAHTLQAHLRFPGSAGAIELLQYVAPVGEPMHVRPRDPGTAHVAVTCNDLVGLVSRLMSYGARPFGDPVTLNQGINRGSVVVYLRDPDQHVLELVQPPS